MISKLFQAPDAKMFNRVNETLRTNFSQNLISSWSEIKVKLYSKINTGMSNSLNKSYRKVHQFLSSSFSIFLPSNGLELIREVEDPWISFPMVQFFSWLEFYIQSYAKNFRQVSSNFWNHCRFQKCTRFSFVLHHHPVLELEQSHQDFCRFSS